MARRTTERPARSDPPVRRKGLRRPGPLPVVWFSLASFLTVLVLLAAQVQAGMDPALTAAAKAHPRHRVVVVRRVIVRTVIDRVVPAGGSGGGSGSGGGGYGSYSSGSYSGSGSSYSAPAAPAPAPVTSSS